jgi:hypothetical protein
LVEIGGRSVPAEVERAVDPGVGDVALAEEELVEIVCPELVEVDRPEERGVQACTSVGSVQRGIVDSGMAVDLEVAKSPLVQPANWFDSAAELAVRTRSWAEPLLNPEHSDYWAVQPSAARSLAGEWETTILFVQASHRGFVGPKVVETKATSPVQVHTYHSQAKQAD